MANILCTQNFRAIDFRRQKCLADALAIVNPVQIQPFNDSWILFSVTIQTFHPIGQFAFLLLVTQHIGLKVRKNHQTYFYFEYFCSIYNHFLLSSRFFYFYDQLS